MALKELFVLRWQSRGCYEPDLCPRAVEEKNASEASFSGGVDYFTQRIENVR
jgi:hypothetical protein